MFAVQSLIHQRRQIRAAAGGNLKALLDQIGRRDHGAHAIRRVVERFEKRSNKKKSRARSPAQKLCRPFYLEKLGLILIDEATLLVRVRAPPETWTTRP